MAAAVSEAGEAYVWRCQPSTDQAAALSTQLLARVRVGAAPKRGVAAGAGDIILAAHLEATADGGE